MRVTVSAVTEDPFTLTRKYAAVLFKAETVGEIEEDEETDDEATEEKAITEQQRKTGNKHLSALPL